MKYRPTILYTTCFFLFSHNVCYCLHTIAEFRHTMYSFCVLEQWPCVIFIILPPAHSLKFCFKERQDRNKIILRYFLSEQCTIFVSLSLWLFPTLSSLFLPAPTNCISRHSTPTLAFVVYDQKPISAGSNEKKKNQASSLGRDRGAECKLLWQAIPCGLNCKKKH